MSQSPIWPHAGCQFEGFIADLVAAIDVSRSASMDLLNLRFQVTHDRQT